MFKRAIVVGASGLVGSELLDILLNNPGYDEVLALVRKELPVKHEKLRQLIVDFDQLEKYTADIIGDAIFSCLGTTRHKTPNSKTYWKIDHDYPVQLAQMGLKNGVRQFHLVSAIGSNAKASNFYIKMKGQTEEDIIKVGLPSTHIFQPSMITGDRKESRIEEHIFKGIFKVIDPLLFGSLKKYRSVPARAIASVMYKQSLKNEDGTFIYPSDKIIELS